MTRLITTSIAVAALMLPAVPAFAQDAAMVQVAESEEYGQYLTDGEGRALYLFTADTQGQGDTQAQVSCEGECLDAWPPFYTQGEPQAGDMADASLLGTIDHEGQIMVTYNGWPLYYFARDEGAGATSGQDIESFGGEWYLVSPEGEQIEE
ncbi:hypothetical protein [Chelativorans sp. M5D2P16]|uniref:COG4315 family predicted lipoprotein n=1 Tax=Chelativorans sp. M5D2P16 TaxID=3095678 RepID=UPI002ACADC7A|nr:hypothetical protein [Chelativorans sp. M5D2P16]MDZ5697171.1 hypothetical protein [Chelativorans sp. M5D2P16]